MLKFDILNRFTGAVQFTAEIDCDGDAPVSLKVGASVRWAVENGASLDGASLVGASLRNASLDGASLDGASLRNASLDGASLRNASLRNASLDGASLRNASLDGASLVDASLDGARLVGASLVDGGQRSDGYRFVGWIRDGVLQIRAGCRNFSVTEAWEHWKRTRGGTPLGDETSAILTHIETVAKIRGLTKND